MAEVPRVRSAGAETIKRAAAAAMTTATTRMIRIAPTPCRQRLPAKAPVQPNGEATASALLKASTCLCGPAYPPALRAASTDDNRAPGQSSFIFASSFVLGFAAVLRFLLSL